MEIDRKALEEWQRDQPLCILQLDAADRTVLKVADERDAIQKKTFTKWVNKHLKKVGLFCRDLFDDLRDGHSLLSLLETLSGESLPRERGRMRFHAIQNVEIALKFLRYKNIKWVNIRGEDIVDGNPKLTLGLIWTIILHFQISDIIIGQTNVSAKEALLRWAQRTTSKYPHVNAKDFMSSWRDGLAFCAIVHRNRPDLLDWQIAVEMQVRDRLDLAFRTMEMSYGVTRLLDPEDVDIPQPDEKSLITYVSQLYDVFPNPPFGHPLLDQENRHRLQHYQDSANSLLAWMKEQTLKFQDQSIGSSLTDLKQIANELKLFGESEIPSRQNEKRKIFQDLREIESFVRGSGNGLPRVLSPDNLDRVWIQLMAAFKDKQKQVLSEIKRIESSNNSSGKIQQLSESGEVEKGSDRASGLANGFPKKDIGRQQDYKDANNLFIQTKKSSNSETEFLKNGVTPKEEDDLHELQEKNNGNWDEGLQLPNGKTEKTPVPRSDKMDDLKLLEETINWINKKIVQIENSNYGNDITSIIAEVEKHEIEFEKIKQFAGNVENCRLSGLTSQNEQSRIFDEKMAAVEDSYQLLFDLAAKRKLNLQSLHDFVFAVNDELGWVYNNEFEAMRGWSDRNLQELEKKYETLCFEIENRKTKFVAVQKLGESLIIQKHPALPIIESNVNLMKARWDWIMELSKCLEVHVRHELISTQFFNDCQEAHEWIVNIEEDLHGNSTMKDFLESFERVQDDLLKLDIKIQSLQKVATAIVPLQPKASSFIATAIIDYHNEEVTVQSGTSYKIQYDADPNTWKLIASPNEQFMIAPILFHLCPPDQEAVDLVNDLKKRLDCCELIWKENSLLPINDQENSEESGRLLTSGTTKAEISQENLQVFQQKEQPFSSQLDDTLAYEKLQRNSIDYGKIEISEKNESLRKFQQSLSNLRDDINELCKNHVARDMISHLAEQDTHDKFRDAFGSLEDEIQSFLESFDKTNPDVRESLEQISSMEKCYAGRLDAVKLTLISLESVIKATNDVKSKLSSYESIPSDFDNLQRARCDLMDLQNEIHGKQPLLNELFDNLLLARTATENTRPKSLKNPDVDQLEEECNRVAKNWEKVSGQVSERFTKCETACNLLEKYKISNQGNTHWMDELDSKLKDLEEYETKGSAENREKDFREKLSQNFHVLNDLNTWLDQVLIQIANQDGTSDDLDILHTQVKSITLVKSDVDDHYRIIKTTSNIISKLSKSNADQSDVDELKQLQCEMERFEDQYELVAGNVNKLFSQMHAAYEELNKFKTELTDFRIWMGQAFDVLESNQKQFSNLNLSDVNIEAIKDFVKDVITNGADLKFINISCQKFSDLTKDCNDILEDITKKSKFRDSNTDHNRISRDLSDVSHQYQQLLLESNNLLDLFSRINADLREFNEKTEGANNWLSIFEPRALDFVGEKIETGTGSLDSQVQTAKKLQTEIVDGGKLVKDAKYSAASLLKSNDDVVSIANSSRENIVQTVDKIERRFEKVDSAISDHCSRLEMALTETQGLRSTLDSLSKWMDCVDRQFEVANQPASLNRWRLNDQLEEVRKLQVHLKVHEASIQLASQMAQANSQSVQESERLGSEIEEVQARFGNLSRVVESQASLLQEVSDHLEDFDSSVMSFKEHLNNPNGVNSNKLLDQHQFEFDSILTNGRNLVSRDDVSDTKSCIDAIEMMEKMWRELLDHFREREVQNSARKLSLQEYDSKRDQIIDWLEKMELEIGKFAHPAIDLAVLHKQEEELSNLTEEHKSYAEFINTLTDISREHEVLLQQLDEDLTSTSSQSRKTSSIDRKTSKSSYPEDSMSSTLQEIRTRFEVLGRNLANKGTDLTTMRKEVEHLLSNLEEIRAFMDEQEKKLPKESFPSEKFEIEDLRKNVKYILEQFQENQPKLEETKICIRDFLKKNSNSVGKEQLEINLSETAVKWKGLQEECKLVISLLDGLKEFYETHDGLTNWLNSKSRLLRVLGPTSFDPRMIQSQLNQILVMEEEFHEKEGSKDRLSLIHESLQSEFGHLAESQPTGEKLDCFKSKWGQDLSQLRSCAKVLSELEGPSTTFAHTAHQLQESLGKISDNLDEIVAGKETPQQKLLLLNDVAENLESQSPLLSEMETICTQLDNILSDPAFISEVNNKVTQLERRFQSCKRKLDNSISSQDNAAKEENDFYTDCQRLQNSLEKFESALSDDLRISCLRDSLLKQLEDFEPFYVEIMACEHEVIMMVEKSKAILPSSSKTEVQAKQKVVGELEKEWLRIKKLAKDRKKRLHTSLELSHKLAAALGKLSPWIDQTEAQCSQMAPIAFFKPNIQNQEKEVQTLKNELNRHASEYEGVSLTGINLLDACDIDKDEVVEELDSVKTRWGNLNSILTNRGEAISNVLPKLTDFHDIVKDVGNNLVRMEDRLLSLQTVPQNERNLESIKGMMESQGELEKWVDKVKQDGTDLIDCARDLGSDAGIICETIDDLHSRVEKLGSSLKKKGKEIEEILFLISLFNGKLKEISQELSALDDELVKMGSTGRDLETLTEQQEEIRGFLSKLDSKEGFHDELISLIKELELTNPSPSPEELKTLVTISQKQLEEINEKGLKREEDVDRMKEKVQKFYDAYKDVWSSIQNVVVLEQSFGPLGSDIDQIRMQQEELKTFQTGLVDNVNKDVCKINKTGQKLVQTASTEVSTSLLESDLEKMNDSWNSLKKSISEREKKLDLCLMQSGQFKEALSGLIEWFNEMDDMVDSQKAPSSDFKVIKAQIQEQKFVVKLLGDRKNGIESLTKMGREMMLSAAEDSERENIEAQIGQVESRYRDLGKKCSERMSLLEEAIQVAKEYHEKLGPLEKWLDRTIREVMNMKTIPSEANQVQQAIDDHENLHAEVMSKQPSFADLADVANALLQIVSEDDALALTDKIEELTNSYSSLVSDSEKVGSLLQSVSSGLLHFAQIYETFLVSLEKSEKDVSELDNLAVYPETLLVQTAEISGVRNEIVAGLIPLEEVKICGNELIKHVGNEEAMKLKEKMDYLLRKYDVLETKSGSLLDVAKETFQLVESFHLSYNQSSEWLTEIEEALQSVDASSLEDQEMEMKKLEQSVVDNKGPFEIISATSPHICQISPGDGAKIIEELTTRVNRRLDAVCDQIQKRNANIQRSIQRSVEVILDINELLDWYREVESQIKDAEPPSSDPELIRIQLVEHKTLNDDISCQKGRTRDIVSNAKKILRESGLTTELENVKEKLDDLNDMMGVVIKLSNDRLNILEQALPLSEHFNETLGELKEWLDYMEKETMNQLLPGMRPDQIAKQQEINRSFRQSIQDHKSVLERLNKSGGALMKLVFEEEAFHIQESINSANQRYNALKNDTWERQQHLEEAMHECFQFTDKLDGMLNALANTADQIKNPEPISANPEKIKEQMEDNNAIISDLEKKEAAYDAVKKVAADIIDKAPNKDDQAIVDIKKKLEKLNNLWDQIQKATKERSDSLEDALALSEKFWDELQQVMANLKTIQDTLISQDPPDIEPNTIESQHLELKGIKEGIDISKSGVDKCRQTGNKLIGLIGESEKPELKRHIEDLDHAWENVTTVYARKEKNMLEALEKAMEFHNTLQNLLNFLEKSECKFDNLGHIAMDIDAVKAQIEELKKFKSEVDPWMVKIEALNRQAHGLSECTSSHQIRAIKDPLVDVNCRWDELNKAINNRQKELEHALLHLGQLQHALGEILVWVDCTDKTLDSLKPVFGDPSVIEVELAKLKVMVNDIHAHQSSVDILNDASRQIIELEKGSSLASQTQQTISQLNARWNQLLEKARNKQTELEDALKEAQIFNMEIQDMLSWLDDIDAALTSAKPVGGLPETAKDQLTNYMELYKELDAAGPKIDGFLESGAQYLKKSQDGCPGNLQNNLKTLKTKWDNAIGKANDKKIKLEIALKEAGEFHETLQSFIDWLTNAEKVLGNLRPVSKVLENVKSQIEDHKEFQAEVSLQRETMQCLDKKGTHLKYFSQKQDVILIKNLLASVQYRWEKIVSKSAERTRALDFGYREAREFHEAWETLCEWLFFASESLNQVSTHGKNDPTKIKVEIEQHKEFQKELSSKQPDYDFALKCGKNLKDKAHKLDEPILKSMLTELKNKWLQICNLSVEKQRKLEEALLFSGQFRDALKALMSWTNKMVDNLDENIQVHGDLDTVMSLVESHNALQEELNGRVEQVRSLRETAEELLMSADQDDADKINLEMTELARMWDLVWNLSKAKAERLDEALKKAEELHKSVNMLLEWLSDAEMKLRFSGPLSEDELEVVKQIQDHEKFLEELQVKEKDKDHLLFLTDEILASCSSDAATTIKQWITIIQSRWDEVASWATQRFSRLQDHLKELKNLLTLMEELMQFLTDKENFLLEVEQESLPDTLEEVRALIDEHQFFTNSMTLRQSEISSICKPSRVKVGGGTIQKRSKSTKYSGSDISEDQNDHETPRKTSRSSLGGKSTSESIYSPRFSDRKKTSSQLGVSQEMRSPRTKPLWDKWNHVWQMAREYDQRLKDKQNYLIELERVKNFDWDDWRKMFLKHHNNKKSRVSDLFRKLDEDGDGFLSRENFVDGLLKTKLLSSRLELNAVADKFDHGEGAVDWREFMAALRPDWQDRGPLSDAERIDDEINRQVALCSCKQKFKVFQVGEGKYRFGDSQKLRLVRILRSTVMVRVGGGWAGLEEFLLKNDPCRGEHENNFCPFGDIQVEIGRRDQQWQHTLLPINENSKGRTNIELREQFILASGVTQAMTTFRSRPSFIGQNLDVSTGRTQGQRLSVTGPPGIKERGTPMSGRASFNSGASYIDTHFNFNPRRHSALSGSKNGSRPPSQAGSNISLDSDESSLRGVSVRRTSSVRSGARSSLGGERIKGRPEVYTPLGFGSSAPRKWSSPHSNGRAPSNSSSDRTPLAGRMRSKSYITPRPSDLIKSTSATNIPKFIGCFSSNNNSATSTPARSRTPSSSNIPVPIMSQRNRTTSITQRSESGLSNSDIPRRTSKTTTSTSFAPDGSRITKTSTTTINFTSPFSDQPE